MILPAPSWCMPWAAGKNDPGFVHNGPLGGLVAVCAESDVMHPQGALVVGAVFGFRRVWRAQGHHGPAPEPGRRV